MRFINRSNNKRLEIICTQANKLIRDGSFWAKWLKIQKFNLEYTSPEVTSSYILDQFKYVPPRTMDVFCFKSRNPWSKSNGYTLPNQSGKMWLNTRKFNRSDASMIATLFHESIHYLDALSPYTFGHGNNFSKNTHDELFQNGCVPEVLADLVYLHLIGIKSDQDSSIK